MRGAQLEQARELKILAAELVASRLDLQHRADQEWAQIAHTIGSKIEDIWKTIGAAHGLEDTQCWNLITEFLEDHDVAFLVLDEKADRERALMETRLGTREIN